MNYRILDTAWRIALAVFAALLFVSLLQVSPIPFSWRWLMVWGSASGLVAVAVLMDGRRN